MCHVLQFDSSNVDRKTAAGGQESVYYGDLLLTTTTGANQSWEWRRLCWRGTSSHPPSPVMEDVREKPAAAEGGIQLQRKCLKPEQHRSQSAINGV